MDTSSEIKKEIKVEEANISSSYLSTSKSPALTRIGDIDGTKNGVHVVGKVTYTSRVEEWCNSDGDGHKLCFDIGDETGTIRAFGWLEAADNADKVIRRGQIIALLQCDVLPRNAQFNNLSHPWQLKLNVYGNTLIHELKGYEVSVKEEETNFVSFEEVRRFPENTYFSVRGKVVSIHPLYDGIGVERATVFQKQDINIEDETGDVLTVVSWNRYIPVSRNTIGQTLEVIRAKFIPGWQTVNPSGAHIIINGERII